MRLFLNEKRYKDKDFHISFEEYAGLNGQKIGQGKVLYLMQLFLHTILFGEKFIKLKIPYTSA